MMAQLISQKSKHTCISVAFNVHGLIIVNQRRVWDGYLNSIASLSFTFYNKDADVD